LNITHINYVLEVHACGSINRAAKNLYTSQSNLSNAIKRLEMELGYKIFVRKNNGVSLTPEGEFFLESAIIIRDEANRIQNVPLLFKDHKNLSIVCNHSSLCMQSLIMFKKSNPDNSIQDFFKETSLITARKDIIEQRYRLAVCYCFSQRLAYHTEIALRYNLKMEVLYQNIPIMALMSKKNPLSKKAELTIDELSKQKLVCFEDFECDNWLRNLGILETNNVLYIFDRGGLAEAVRKDNYIALVMNDPLQTKEMEDCISLPITKTKASLDMFLLQPRNYILNNREKSFIKFIKSRLREVHQKE